jgi:outer membrane protein assembly factor BamD
VKLHPTHPKVDYAAYRAALSHFKEFKQTASDFFIFPPAYEKDQAELRAALQSMNDFERNYPESSYKPEAKKVAYEARQQLAAHEMYVAAFYAKRKRWPAAIHRWEGVVATYPNLGPDQEALFKLADAYRTQVFEPAKAKEALKKIVERYPNTPAAQKAQAMLGS